MYENDTLPATEQEVLGLSAGLDLLAAVCIP